MNMLGSLRRLSFLWVATTGILVAGCHKGSPLPTKGSPAPSIGRLQWNISTTVDSYWKIGSNNPSWDHYATNALIEFARFRSGTIGLNEPFKEIIATNVLSAVNAGCNDPFVNYLYLRNCLSSTADRNDFTIASLAAANQMDLSAYPAIRKFYASFRAVEQYAWANNYPSNSPANVVAIQRQMVNHFQSVLDDTTIPVQEIYEAVHEFLHMFSGNASGEAYEHNYKRIEPYLFKNWPDASESWLIKGEAYYIMACQARGEGYANAITDEKWKQFFAKLSTAENAFRKAWELNSNDVRIATFMVLMAEAQQKDRNEMELWFNRAMHFDTNNYDVCKDKLHYLSPHWYGSREEMLTFGRECVASTNWGGYVPMVLVDAHTDYNNFSQSTEEQKEAYWKKPDVWPDIKAAYERFFQLNPEEVGIYKNYAWYAYHAEQWSEFLRISKRVRPEDYIFFGDKDSFPKMVNQAKEHFSSNGKDQNK